MPLKLVQVNLNHTAAAQDLLLQAMAEEKWDLAIISEPYRVPEHPHWAGDTEGMATVVWAGSENSPPHPGTGRYNKKGDESINTRRKRKGLDRVRRDPE